MARAIKDFPHQQLPRGRPTLGSAHIGSVCDFAATSAAVNQDCREVSCRSKDVSANTSNLCASVAFGVPRVSNAVWKGAAAAERALIHGGACSSTPCVLLSPDRSCHPPIRLDVLVPMSSSRVAAITSSLSDRLGPDDGVEGFGGQSDVKFLVHVVKIWSSKSLGSQDPRPGETKPRDGHGTIPSTLIRRSPFNNCIFCRRYPQLPNR